MPVSISPTRIRRPTTATILSLLSVPLLGGCGLVLGLDDYELEEDDSTSLGGAASGGAASGGAASGGAASGGAASGGAASGGGDGTDCEDDCEDFNDCTNDTCIEGQCSHTTVSAGDPCQSGVCNGSSGSPACIRCIDDQAGSSRDLGCTEGAPICDESDIATCTGCDVHADCDDGDACTTDSCNAQGECGYAPNQSDPSCTASCLDDRPGAEQDTECTSARPICAGGECVACAIDAHCAGGTECEPMACESGVCVQEDVRQTIELITAAIGDGSFEQGATAATWQETGPAIRFNCLAAGCESGNSDRTIFLPSEGSLLAWLGGNYSAQGSLYQVLTLPAGLQALHLKADTNFLSDESAGGSTDTLSVTLRSITGNHIADLEAYVSEDVPTDNPAWISDGIDGSYGSSHMVPELAGQTIRLSFDYTTNGNGITDYMIDRVRLSAEVCQQGQ